MSETLSITKDAAIKAYEAGTAKQKALLENLFNKKTFLKDKTERLKTLDDIFAEVGHDSAEVKKYHTLLQAGINDHTLSALEAEIIAKAFNGDWVPDWSNSSEPKFVQWWVMDPSGAGFRFFGYDGWYSFSIVGSRLCFKERKHAEYAAKQFPETYKAFMVIQ